MFLVAFSLNLRSACGSFAEAGLRFSPAGELLLFFRCALCLYHAALLCFDPLYFDNSNLETRLPAWPRPLRKQGTAPASPVSWRGRVRHRQCNVQYVFLKCLQSDLLVPTITSSEHNTGCVVSTSPFGSLQNSECAPFGPTFSVDMAPLGCLGAQFQNMGSRRRALFLGLKPPLWVQKTWNLENTKNIQNTKWIDQKCMLCVA